MPHLCSPVKEIDQLWFDKWKSGTVLKEVDVLISDEGSTVFIRRKDGRVLCSKLQNYSYTPDTWRFNDPVLNGLVKLGVLTKEAAQQHKDYCKNKASRREERYAAEALLRDSERLGIKLTAAQKEKINAALGKTK